LVTITDGNYTKLTSLKTIVVEDKFFLLLAYKFAEYS
jgi:hypothetical protein